MRQFSSLAAVAVVALGVMPGAVSAADSDAWHDDPESRFSVSYPDSWTVQWTSNDQVHASSPDGNVSCTAFSLPMGSLNGFQKALIRDLFEGFSRNDIAAHTTISDENIVDAGSREIDGQTAIYAVGNTRALVELTGEADNGHNIYVVYGMIDDVERKVFISACGGQSTLYRMYPQDYHVPARNIRFRTQDLAIIDVDPRS